jgi:hypothetical protein
VVGDGSVGFSGGGCVAGIGVRVTGGGGSRSSAINVLVIHGANMD